MNEHQSPADLSRVKNFVFTVSSQEFLAFIEWNYFICLYERCSYYYFL